MLIGYFPKKITQRPEWLAANQVRLIYSASTCIAKDPDGRLCDWDLNPFGLFNTSGDAERVIPVAERASYEVFAYRLLPAEFDGGIEHLFIAPELAIEPMPAEYVSVGYDAVSRSVSAYFECSPLSCNSGAAEFETNEYCLFRDLESAVAGARVFSAGDWEPGPYYVLEVLKDASQ